MRVISVDVELQNLSHTSFNTLNSAVVKTVSTAEASESKTLHHIDSRYIEAYLYDKLVVMVEFL